MLRCWCGIPAKTEEPWKPSLHLWMCCMMIFFPLTKFSVQHSRPFLLTCILTALHAAFQNWLLSDRKLSKRDSMLQTEAPSPPPVLLSIINLDKKPHLIRGADDVNMCVIFSALMGHTCNHVIISLPLNLHFFSMFWMQLGKKNVHWYKGYI